MTIILNVNSEELALIKFALGREGHSEDSLYKYLDGMQKSIEASKSKGIEGVTYGRKRT